jgi:hypothetical protein
MKNILVFPSDMMELLVCGPTLSPGDNFDNLSNSI